MRTKRPFTTVFYIQSLALLLALALATGCRTNGYHKSEAAGKSLREAAAEVQAESRAIDATVEALNDLVNNPASDLKPQFRRYSKALDRLVATAAQTERTRAEMELKSAEYFDAWDRQTTGINYGIIREQSEARRAEVTNRFHSINTRYQDAQGVVRPLITYFNDIRTALSVDLTPAGLDAVKSIVSNADNNARKVQVALGRLTEDLAISGSSLSTIGVRVRETDSAPGTNAPVIQN